MNTLENIKEIALAAYREKRKKDETQEAERISKEKLCNIQKLKIAVKEVLGIDIEPKDSTIEICGFKIGRERNGYIYAVVKCPKCEQDAYITICSIEGFGSLLNGDIDISHYPCYPKKPIAETPSKKFITLNEGDTEYQLLEALRSLVMEYSQQ